MVSPSWATNPTGSLVTGMASTRSTPSFAYPSMLRRKPSGSPIGPPPRMSPDVDRSVLVSAARQIVLFHLDRAWAEHLAFLADLREGIHLRATATWTYLVHENPFGTDIDRALRSIARRIRKLAV
jgi:hypothetical protein